MVWCSATSGRPTSRRQVSATKQQQQQLHQPRRSSSLPLSITPSAEPNNTVTMHAPLLVNAEPARAFLPSAASYSRCEHTLIYSSFFLFLSFFSFSLSPLFLFFIIRHGISTSRHCNTPPDTGAGHLAACDG